MTEPLISVIVATHNRRDLLPRALDSILNQSLQDFEIIIVDDCSTDGTDKVIKKYCDKYQNIRTFRMDKPSGHEAKPKNFGMLQAKGAYIAMLDDDDWYKKDCLKILYKYQKHTNADVVYGDYVVIKKGGKKEIGWSIDFDPVLLGKFNYIAGTVALVKKEALLAVGGFNENVPKFKDWNLWLRINKAGFKFLHVPIPVFFLDMTDDRPSISSKYKVKYDEQGHYLPILINQDGTETEMFNPADEPIWALKTCMGQAPKLKVAVYTLTMNRLEYTKKMYEAMSKLAGYEFDWYCVDQNSTDGTKEFLQGKTKKVLYNKTNTGVGEGWNQAVDLIKNSGIKYEIICKFDNDGLIMTDNWLAMMIDLFERNRNIILSPAVEGLEDSPGGVLRQMANNESPYLMINEKILGFVPNLGGIVFATPIELFDNFRFPPNLPGNKDYFLSQYAKSLGYNLFYMEESRVFHQDGTKGQHLKYPEYFEKTVDDKINNYGA